jgi:hypothetical protein
MKKVSYMPETLEIKLASIVIHTQELLSPDGRVADKEALKPLLNDPEITTWLKSFDKAKLLEGK